MSSQNQKLTTDTFKMKANLAHNNLYDYDKVDYVNSKSKIIITCRTHGDFIQAAKNHLGGQGCMKCKTLKLSKLFVGSKEKFVISAISIHGAKYDYSKVDYVDTKTKVIIVCKIHDDFEQTPNCHLSGRGCPKCGIKVKEIGDVEGFITKSRLVHGDVYDYDKVAFRVVRDRIIITCKIHGDFEQSVKSHLEGHGCTICGHNLLTHSEFSKKVKEVHGEIYGYNLDDTKLFHELIIDIECSKHGTFRQSINNHLAGHGCNQCSVERNADKCRLSVTELILRAKTVHGDLYCYDDINYTSLNDTIIVGCNKHGSFSQIVSNHLNGNGCPRCALERAALHQSKGQLEVVNFVSEFIDNEIIQNDRDAIKPYELDIYIPSLKLAIEYHGSYYHSYGQIETEKQIYNHYNKAVLAYNNDIKLLQFFEHEWIKKPNIVKSIIKFNLNKNDNVDAYKCVLKIIDNQTMSEFLDDNSLTTSTQSDINYGLYYDNLLVYCISFLKTSDRDYMICNNCNIIDHDISNAFQICFDRFNLDNLPELVTFNVDRRFICDKTLYGFIAVDVAIPNWVYYKALKIYDKSIGELQEMFDNGYRRIWDAGYSKLEWRRP